MKEFHFPPEGEELLKASVQGECEKGKKKKHVSAT